MKTLKLFSLLMLSLFFVSMVSAVPPVTTTQSFAEGYILDANFLDYIKINESYDLIVYISNISNGMRITGETANCSMRLFNPTGTSLFSNYGVVHSNHFHFIIGGENFSEEGTYIYQIHCNSSRLGGHYLSSVIVNNNGKPTPDGIIILGFCLIMILIFSTIIFYLVRAIGLIIDANFDILDISYAWGLYFGLLGINLLADVYLGSVVIQNWLELFVTLLGFPLIIIPVVAFFLSLFRTKKKEKEKKAEW